MPEFHPRTMIALVLVLSLSVLGALGILTNPKAERGPSLSGDVTRATVEKAGAKIMPTVNP
jgi:hypothetical protein